MDFFAGAISGAVVATVVGGLFGLWTTVLGHRREHRRWLREQRLEAYTAYVTSVVELSGVDAVFVTRVPKAVAAALNDHNIPRDLRPRLEAAVLEELGGASPLSHVKLIDRMEQAAMRVMVLGPDGIIEPTERLERAAIDIALDKPEATFDGLNEALFAFARSARVALARRA